MAGPGTEDAQSFALGRDELKEMRRNPKIFPNPGALLENKALVEQLSRELRVLFPKAPDRVDVTDKNPIDWDDDPTSYQACTIAHGHILTFKQQWAADGYSMGTLLYSLPLAPGQKRQIAIVDWERRESALRSEVLTETEQLAADLARDRDVNEIVNATLGERAEGSSDAPALGFGMGHGYSAGAGGAGSYGGMVLAGGVGSVTAGAFSLVGEVRQRPRKLLARCRRMRCRPCGIGRGSRRRRCAAGVRRWCRRSPKGSGRWRRASRWRTTTTAMRSRCSISRCCAIFSFAIAWWTCRNACSSR